MSHNSCNIFWTVKYSDGSFSSEKARERPCAHLKLPDCGFDWQRSFLVRSGYCQALPLFTPLSSRRLIMWCPCLCAWKGCLELLNTSYLPRRRNPLVMVDFPPVYLLDHLHWFHHVQDSRSRRVFKREIAQRHLRVWTWTQTSIKTMSVYA